MLSQYAHINCMGTITELHFGQISLLFFIYLQMGLLMQSPALSSMNYKDFKLN